MGQVFFFGLRGSPSFNQFGPDGHFVPFLLPGAWNVHRPCLQVTCAPGAKHVGVPLCQSGGRRQGKKRTGAKGEEERKSSTSRQVLPQRAQRDQHSSTASDTTRNQHQQPVPPLRQTKRSSMRLPQRSHWAASTSARQPASQLPRRPASQPPCRLLQVLRMYGLILPA